MIRVYKWMKGNYNKVLVERERARTNSIGFKLTKFRFIRDRKIPIFQIITELFFKFAFFLD